MGKILVENLIKTNQLVTISEKMKNLFAKIGQKTTKNGHLKTGIFEMW